MTSRITSLYAITVITGSPNAAAATHVTITLVNAVINVKNTPAIAV
ncbi:hypothetical protein ACQCVK_12625 [Rossellomorea vietnamensis]|nr:hypothetical protein [Rossellomorea aquimaris]